MTNSDFAARTFFGNIVLFTVATLGLAACGGGETSDSMSNASSLVSPNVGHVDRSAGTTAPATNTAGASNGKASSTPVATTPSTGTTTLDWTPPTENTDGSVLTNLSGYKVYYGTSADLLTQSVKVTNPGLTAYTMSDLPAGTWYFAVSSYSADGAESTRSGVISTAI